MLRQQNLPQRRAFLPRQTLQDNHASIQPVSNPSAPLIATGSGKVNPAHGQPGHRCDIAVGAPLPAAASAPVLNTKPVSTPVINPPAPATTVVQPQPQPAATVASGINPAHGQPGHRCDIPVGESLSKAPAPKATTTTSSPVITPNKPLVEAPDTMFAKGLNPAHGKPGHRCDIAVGQPLASAAKKRSGKNKLKLLNLIIHSNSSFTKFQNASRAIIRGFKKDMIAGQSLLSKTFTSSNCVFIRLTGLPSSSIACSCHCHFSPIV